MLIAPRTETTPALAAAGWVRVVGLGQVSGRGVAGRKVAGHGATLAAERVGPYVSAPSTPAPATTTTTPTSRTAARLGEVAGLLDGRDRTLARVVSLLLGARAADDLAEVTGGMSLHVWLQHTARCTHVEARDLLATVETLERMPATAAGLADGWLSWSQVSAICRAARTVRVRLLDQLDRLVADAMVAHRDVEPDAIVADVWDWADRHQPSRLERAEAATGRDRFATLSPRLVGGGTLFADLDPVGFATLAEALDAPLDPPPAVPDDLDDQQTVDAVFDTLDERRRTLTRQHGTALADRLVGLCERDLAGGNHDTGGAWPLVLATIDLDALLDQTRTPGWLLHTLAGGHMKLSATALQRLVDARRADLRSIVLDDCGQVVGVGRKTHVPPRWLREAIWARDLTVRDPDRSCPVRLADLDHITPWPHGSTTVDNLQPLGRAWHNRKTTRQWTVTRTRDGTTVWRHGRHGWTLRLAPPRRTLARPPEIAPPRPPPPALPLDELDHEPAPG